MARVLAGEAEAFREIVLRCRSDVYRVLFRMTGVKEDAEDLTQETFLRAYRSLDRFQESEPLAPWLITIATRLGLNFLRSRRRAVWVDYAEYMGSEPAPTTAAEENIDRERARFRLQQALKKLGPKERTAIILKYEQGYTAQEIAEILKAPRDTIKTWLLRSRERLLKEMK